MSIYSQRSFDRLNQNLSEAFNISYTRMELSDGERTFIPNTDLSCPGPFAGHSHSEETKLIISQKLNGKKQPNKKTNRKSSDFTTEWKKKISASNKGRIRKQSTEERQRRSEKAKQSDMALCKGRIWVNDGVKSFRIYSENLLDHPEYIKGRL
jgi:hypothetical protein